MNNKDFTEEDRVEALKTSGTGMWRLESDGNGVPRFYGDSYMNMLLGVADDITPEGRYQYFMSRIYKEDLGIFMEYYNTLKDTAQAEVVYRYDHPTMGIIYVRCGGRRSSSDENIICYRGFHQNVTNTIRIEQETRKRLTQQSELYRTVAYKMMETFSDATAKINLNTGTFEWFTFDGDQVEEHPQYEELFIQMKDNVPEEYREEFIRNASLANLRQQLKEKETYSFSVFIHRPSDWELRRITYWYYTVEGSKDSVLSIYRDTTEDYMKEKQLAEALQLAQQANKAKTVFLNNMSHDIRTPMNAIIGFTELAEKYVQDQDKCLEYLNKIKTSSKHLLSLINDVLDMSRIESGRMVIHNEECSVKEIVDGLNTIMQNDAKSRGVSFTVDTGGIRDEYVYCDKLRLNQVLLNCASNSVKFTNEGGRISVVAKQVENPYLQDGYGEYQISIEDTGIGMSEEFLQKIFDPFTREESQVKNIQGTGLGMSICKNIIDLMGGKIEVRSKLGVGTQFVINLQFKLALKQDNTKENQEVDLNLIQGKRILLVEDNEFNREIATEILKDVGAVIETAENGQIAFKKIKDNLPSYYDLVLMDVQMPIMNGYEATKAIRALDREDIAGLQIIAMTANAFEEDKKLAMESGMNSHLSKPIDVDAMLKCMAEHMGKH